jgi:hypothetical protein
MICAVVEECGPERASEVVLVSRKPTWFTGQRVGPVRVRKHFAPGGVNFTSLQTDKIPRQSIKHPKKLPKPFFEAIIYSTAMATAFEPSLSSSLHRQSAMATGPSIADTLPSINFGFDELRERMAKFTTKFDTFIEQGRKNVLEERNQFRINVAELHGSFWPKCIPGCC